MCVMYAADHRARQLRIKVVVIQDGLTRASYVTVCSCACVYTCVTDRKMDLAIDNF